MNLPPIEQIMSVYSGKPGKCCCGCAGKHTYGSVHVAVAEKYRGYKINPDEISDRTVKIIYNKMKAFPPELLEGDNTLVSAETETRCYILYLVP